jgi:hypothetical protein
MPIWGWVCLGLVGLAVAAVGLFYVFLVVPHNREQGRLTRDGQTVVARIILANPSLYDLKPATFEFAFLVFTRDADPSERHLAFLGRVAASLQRFEPDETDPDEKKLAWALQTQRTIGDVVRIPDRVTGGREVYFTTTPVKRRMLPDGKLTREYLYLRVIPEGRHRAASMIEYPDFPRGST